MTEKTDMKELSWSDLKFFCGKERFKFESTEELEITDEVYGQDRACKAIDFGVGIKSHGYNIFVMGPVGTGKTTAIHRALARIAKDQSSPEDWLYVNNFDDTSRPIALKFPTGLGQVFKNEMVKLLEELKVHIPKAFETEHYQEQRKLIIQELEKQRQEELARLADFAAERNIELRNMGRGFVMIPIKEGKQLQPEDFDKLSLDEKKLIEKHMSEIHDTADTIMETVGDIEEKIVERIKALDRRITDTAVGRSIGRLRKKYKDYPFVINYLNSIRNEVLENVSDFLPKHDASEDTPLPQLMGMQREPDFSRYEVNLLTSNTEGTGAPVIYENNPTYYNLIGRIEHKITPSGAFDTDFTMIKPGSLHRANGGYLIIEVNELFKNYMAYDALKRCLKNSQVIIEDINEQFRLITTVALRPEPIPLDVKIILIGNPYAYYVLYSYDEDFQKLFKVKADFGYEMDLDESTLEDISYFIASLTKRENLKHFSSDAVCQIAEFASRLAGQQNKLATSFSRISDIIRESSYWAGINGNGIVHAPDVERALDEKEYRSNRIEQKLQEMIEDGDIMVSSDGEVVGQVNGLAVMSFGDFMFGKPSRITARHHAGKGGIIQIEREVKLSGRIHDKGLMILSAYLRSLFGRCKSYSFSASLTFEQVYEEIEGDSASSTELYALLSSLSGLPIKQGIAVTGSVNQYGEIQPIGGANYKIEGFFAICKVRGFTGQQGVIIPHQNVKNLALKNEVIEAVKDGKFHVWPVKTIEDGIEILTGKPAGKLKRDGTYPKNSVFGKVMERLEELKMAEEEESGKSGKVLRRGRGIKF